MIITRTYYPPGLTALRSRKEQSYILVLDRKEADPLIYGDQDRNKSYINYFDDAMVIAAGIGTTVPELLFKDLVVTCTSVPWDGQIDSALSHTVAVNSFISSTVHWNNGVKVDPPGETHTLKLESPHRRSAGLISYVSNPPLPWYVLELDLSKEEACEFVKLGSHPAFSVSLSLA